MKVEIKTGLGGEQRVQLMRRGKCRYDTGFQKNMLLDAFFEGFTRKGSSHNSTYQQCFVGSGTTPPQPDDIGIENQLGKLQTQGGSSIATTFQGSSEDGLSVVYRQERKFNFVEGAVVGNASELATTFEKGNNYIGKADTRALIKDQNGDPTTIVITAEDQLIVTHRINIYVKKDNVVKTVNVLGTDYEVTFGRVNESVYYSILFFGSLYKRISVNLPSTSMFRMGCSASNYGFPTEPGGTLSSRFPLNSYGAAYATTATGEDMPTILQGKVTYTFAASTHNVPDGNGIAFMTFGSIETRWDRVPYLIGFVPNMPKDNKHKMTLVFTFTYARL